MHLYCSKKPCCYKLMIALTLCLSFFTTSSCKNSTKKNPHILWVITSKLRGGGVEATLTLYNIFTKKGYDITLLITKGSMLEKELIERHMPYISCELPRRFSASLLLADATKTICKKKKIDIICCNKPNEYKTIKEIANSLKIPAIAFYHSYEYPSSSKSQIFSGFQAFITSSNQVANAMQDIKRGSKLNIDLIDSVYPLHREEKFLNFTPNRTKHAFFKEEFNIQIKQYPIICMVANMDTCKNHELLLHAAHMLIYENDIPVQIILAGGPGVAEKKLKKMTLDLNLNNHVHFLGFTHHIPELLHHSDISVLTSRNESYGIALLEAALMKKPIILSKTAMLAGIFIQDKKTGLLCAPDNPNQLASQIKQLLEEPELATKLGENAYELATHEFSNDASVEKLEEIFKALDNKKCRLSG